MKCPSCGTYDAHPVVKTFARQYKWTDKATELFLKISDGDLSLRQRQKRCMSCNRTFVTVELSKHYLSDLMEHIDRLIEHADMRDEECNALRAESAAQKVEIDRLKGLL